MKDYREYMDTISLEAAAHDKIVAQAREGPPSVKQRRPRFWYAGIAAGFLALFFGVWMVFGLLDVSEEDFGPLLQEPGDNALIFNAAEAGATVGFDRAVDYFLDLNDEQINAAFPALNLPLIAWALYLRDGSFIEVKAHTVAHYGPMVFIRVGAGQLEDCVIIVRDEEPQISNIHGVPVTALIADFLTDSVDGFVGWVSLQADFMLDGFHYRVELSGDNKELAQAQMSEIVEQLILGGTAGMTLLLDPPELPDFRSESPTLEEARLDPDFGVFVPDYIPAGFYFEFSSRWVGQHEDHLYIEWHAPRDYAYLYTLYQQWSTERAGEELFPFAQIAWHTNVIRWGISEVAEHDWERVVPVEEPIRYDWSLWPDVDALWQLEADVLSFFEPIFLVEELTFEVVQARFHGREWSYQIIDGALTDEPFAYYVVYEMEFGVLFGDILIRVSTQGVSAEQLWAMLSRLPVFPV